MFCLIADYNISVLSGNFALRQPVSLSSVYGNIRHAHYAVDGNPSGADNSKCAISTVQDNPFWFVDLGRTRIVDEVYIVGRTDCCTERIIGSEIRVGKKITQREQ